MRAYVIGNVAIDETISVSSMPQAGASILGREETRDLGGKGANQAVVMGRSGLPTTLISAIGEDHRGRMIAEQLAHEPVEASLVSLADRPSDFSIIFTTPDGENAIVTTTESAEALSLEAATERLATAQPGDLVALQGNLSEHATRGILALARDRDLATAFNPSPLRPYHPDLLPLTDTVFVNEGEAEHLSGASGEAAVRALLAAGAKRVVLTLGARGALLAEAGGNIAAIPAVRAKAVDTTGAGDTFMAVALASAALRGVAIDTRAVAHGAAAAALTVSRRGTRSAFPSPDELAAILAG